MKILLIFPPKTLWVSREVTLFKGIDDESGSYIPLGLLYVATYLKRNSAHTVEVLDAAARHSTLADVEREIGRHAPDIVGIYACTEYLYDALATAEIAKKLSPKRPVVLGGPHLTNYLAETVVHPAVDFCVFGEGEIAFQRLVAAIERGEDAPAIAGVVTKENKGRPVELQRVADLDSLPFPDRSLLDVSLYRSPITYDNPTTTMMTSRGCAFNCYYCSNIERSQKVRMRSAANVVDEMEEIVRSGIRDILFFDENFTFSIPRVREICAEILRRKLKVRWHCRSRADMALSDEVLRAMKAAGCRMIQFGIETGTARLQAAINKRLDLEKARETVKRAKRAGILAYANFIIGLPTETEVEMRETIRFACSLGLDYAPFSVFNPLPGSVYYEEALANGTIKSDFWREFVTAPEKPIRAYGWPGQDMRLVKEMSYHALRSFYFRPGYILRSLLRQQSARQKFWQLKAGVKLLLLGK